MPRLKDLAQEEWQDRLAGAGLALRVGPYVYAIRSNVPAVHAGIGALYGDFPLAAPEDYADFDVALAGQRYTEEPEEFERLRSTLGTRLVHDGHADLEAYRQLLCAADVVVSTARHEFFGIAVVEAIYAGAFPVLPNQLGSGL